MRLLWEGQPATISGLNQILPFLSANLAFHLELVTDPEYFRFMNKYLKGQTASLIEWQKLDKLGEMNLRSWSIQNLTQASRASAVGILPLNLSKPMMGMKPENRMLIMWRMGLPCLVSPLESFKRVAQNAQVDAVCVSNQDWLDQLLKLSTEVSYVNDQMERAQSYLQEFHSKEVLLKKWDQLARFVLDEK